MVHEIVQISFKKKKQGEGVGRKKETISFFFFFRTYTRSPCPPPFQAPRFWRRPPSSVPFMARKRESRALFKLNAIVSNSEGKQLGFLWGERRPERVEWDC